MKNILLTLSLILIGNLTYSQSWQELNDSAISNYYAGYYPTAITYAEKALVQAKQEFGVSDEKYGTSLYNLAVFYESVGQFEKALPLYVEALSNAEKSLGKWHSDYGIRLIDLAGLYKTMGQYEKALPLYLEALSNTEKSLGKEHSAYGSILNNLAELYESMGQYEKTLPLYIEALSNTEKSLGKEHSDYGTRLNNLAGLYKTMGQYEKALPLYLEALSNAEKSLGKEHSDYGSRLNNLAGLYERMGQYEKALPLYLEALINTEKSLTKEHSTYGIILNNLAGLFLTMGQYEKALPLYIEALSNAEKLLGKEHSDYGSRLNNLAGLYQTMGQYEKALPLALEALINTEKSLGKEHSTYGTRLNGLAILYESMGQYEKALPLYIEALSNAQKSLGKEHSEYGTSLNNLAVLYYRMGYYEKALPLYLEALSNTEKSLGKEHSVYGIRLNNLAVLYESMGQYEKALPLCLEALIKSEKSLGKEHSEYGTSLNNLAGLYGTMGQYEKALPFALEALSNTEKSLGKEHPYYGIRLNSLAVLYNKIGQYEKALPLAIEALSNTEKSLGKEHSEYGINLNNLASLYESMGQFKKALPLYLEALSNTEKSLGKEHSVYGIRLNNLAGLYNQMGQYEKALPLYLEALKLIKLNINKNFAFLSEKDKGAYMETVQFDFANYRSFFLKYRNSLSGIAAEAFDLELASSGMIFKATQQIQQNIVNSKNETAIKTYEQWMELKTILAKNYALPIANRRLDIKTVEDEANKLEGELARLSSSFKQSKTLNSKWKDIQSKLKSNEVAIEFSSFDYHNGKQWTDSTMYIALVLRKHDTYPTIIPLCEAAQLDSLLKKEVSTDANFISKLYRGADVVNKSKTFSYGSRLYQLIWKPLDNLLAKGDKVYYTPSGVLHQIAFAAIPYSDSSLLIDRYDLNQLSSTADILHESPFKETKPESMTLYGGIQYDALEQEMTELVKKDSSEQAFVSRSLSTDLIRGDSWNFLPGTLTETQSITSIAKTNKIEVNSYYGLTALEETYKKNGFGKSPRVIHISTHGFFFPDPEIDKKENLSSFEDNKHVFKYSNNPLNRSGLLFAGANNTWSGNPIPNIEDGILTSYEAANVNLSNTQLVVLSACETGLGDIKGSEGVYGLQRAFKMAGAEYLMMSLWKVPDAETSEFMIAFYTAWFNGKSITLAFNSAQHAMKKKYPNDPYKWAAFVLVR